MKREILHGSGGLKGIGRCSREAFHADPESDACDLAGVRAWRDLPPGAVAAAGQRTGDHPRVRAVVEVSDYIHQTSQFAQSMLRSVLDEVELDELLARREKINMRLQGIINRTSPRDM